MGARSRRPSVYIPQPAAVDGQQLVSLMQQGRSSPSGRLVSGGKQDRVIARTHRPAGGPSLRRWFCVEHGAGPERAIRRRDTIVHQPVREMGG